jgi:hypothetical protein
MPKPYKRKPESTRSKMGDQIFDLTLKEFLRRLKAPASCPSCGSRGLNASDLSNLVKFLGMNSYQVTPTKERWDALDKLKARREEKSNDCPQNTQ